MKWILLSLNHVSFAKEIVEWVTVFKNGPSKICRRESLKSFTWSILEYLDPNVNIQVAYCAN